MKMRLFLSLITVLLLTACLSLTVCAADWNLALQGNLNITDSEDYTITSEDEDGNPVTTENTITIADNITTTITLDNVAILTEDTHGMELGSGASVTLDLVGVNSILNNSDGTVASINRKNSNLTITSKDGGTLKLNEKEASAGISISGIQIDGNLSLDDIDADHFVITEDDDYYTIKDSDNSGDIETGQGSIISVEIIGDDDVPLSDSPDTTITIEGSAKVDGNIPSGSGTYIISTETVINGIPGWDIESLASHIPFAKDYSNLILVAEGEQLKDCRILKNKTKNITIIVSDAGNSVKLKESKLSNKQLTEGVEKEDILHSCRLDLGKKYTDNFIVRFHLGETYAGKPVEIRTMENGSIISKTVTVSKSGIAAITATASGDFVLIAK